MPVGAGSNSPTARPWIAVMSVNLPITATRPPVERALTATDPVEGGGFTGVLEIATRRSTATSISPMGAVRRRRTARRICRYFQIGRRQDGQGRGNLAPHQKSSADAGVSCGLPCSWRGRLGYRHRNGIPRRHREILGLLQRQPGRRFYPRTLGAGFQLRRNSSMPAA